MKIIALAIVFVLVLLFGCGSTDVHISYQFATETQLRAARGVEAPTTVWGFATWSDHDTISGPERDCTIYLLPLDLYPNDTCYRTSLAHEQRHCQEGHFHGPGNTSDPSCGTLP